MKILLKTLLAIAFALALIQLLVLVNSGTGLQITDFALISITGSATALYYFIFERKKK